MSKPVIQVENLSKAYQIGQIGTGTISRDLERFVTTKILGKEDPFLKIGETNDRSKKGDSDIVWSLKDINFQVNQGDAIGIIGKNGAGKSTLLKLLSRVTSPTTGNIKVKGRIASLLEVGTGFHPELSGRENIYLNGAILGMRKKEITRKLDEIIDFSGVERYVDTPVKRYSSGMYVRLAFAVAAHLESEILIVDEVLAVGDAEFQKKCLGKMGDISKGEGRTVLFVSHNMAAVKSLCNRGLILENGIVTGIGLANEMINTYQAINLKNEIKTTWDLGHLLNENIDLYSINIESSAFNNETFTNNCDLIVTIYTNVKTENINLLMDLCLYNIEGLLVFDVVSPPRYFNKGKVEFKCIIPRNLLNIGNYSMSFSVVQNHNSTICKLDNILNFEIVEGQREIEYYNNWPGQIRPKFDWIIK